MLLRLSFFISVLLLNGFKLQAQNCPTEDVLFVSQSQVDSFKILYPDCTYLAVDLTIRTCLKI